MLITAFGLSPTASFAQPTQRATIRVDGEVANKVALSGTELAALPHRSVTVTDDKGAKSVYEGVPVVVLLRRAQVPLGANLKKSQLMLCVIATASDGYRVVFALAEFDSGFTDQIILLADHHNGVPLSAREGPLRVVVPSDKRHARWIRGVTSLTVRNVQ